jgi:hypothetical protein
MKRRNFLKTTAALVAGFFSFKTAQAAAKDDYWIPYFPVNGKGRVRVIYNREANIAVTEYDSDAENLQDVPRQALEKHPYAFDIQLKQDGQTVYQWLCTPQTAKDGKITYSGGEKPIAWTEWVWKERRFAKNGMGGPWVTSFFKDDPVERRVFYVDVPEGKAEKFLVALKEQFAKRRVA